MHLFPSLTLSLLHSCRSADRPEVNNEGHGPSAADWAPAVLCNPHVCHHRSGVLQREATQDLHTHVRNTGYCLFLLLFVSKCNERSEIKISTKTRMSFLTQYLQKFFVFKDIIVNFNVLIH